MTTLPLTIEELLKYGEFSIEQRKKLYCEITNSILKKQHYEQIILPMSASKRGFFR